MFRATADFTELITWLERVKSALGQRIVDAAVQEYEAALQENMHFTSEYSTGKTEAGMSKVFQARQTQPNVWVGGVGDAEVFGSPGEKAPTGTISQFIRWYYSNAGD